MTEQTAGPGRGEPGGEFDGILNELGRMNVPQDPSFQPGLEAHLRRGYQNPFQPKRTAARLARRMSFALVLAIGVLIGASLYGPLERELGLGTVSAQEVIRKAVQISEKMEAAVLHLKASSSIRDVYSGQTNEAAIEEWVDLSDPMVFCRVVTQSEKPPVAQACNGADTFLYLRAPYNGQPGYLVRMRLTDEEKNALRARVLLRGDYLKRAEPHAAKARYIRKETVLDNRPVHTITYDTQMDNPWGRRRGVEPERIPANVTMKVDSDNYRVMSYTEQAQVNGIWFTTFSQVVEKFEMLAQDEIDPLAVVEEMRGALVRLVEIPRTGRSYYQQYVALMAMASQPDYFVPESDLVGPESLPRVVEKLAKVLGKSEPGRMPSYAVRLPGSRYRLHFCDDAGRCLVLENRVPYRSLDRSWNAKIYLGGRSWLVEANFGLEGDIGAKGIFSRDISFLHPVDQPIYIKGRDLTQEEITEFIQSTVVPYDEEERRRARNIPWGDPPILEDQPDTSAEMQAARAWQRATLGLAISPTPDGRGAQVIAVLENGPAARVGVKEGDRLLYLNGVPIANNRALKDELDKRRFGDRVTLTLERDRQIVEVEPVLVRRIYLLNQL